MLEENGGDGRKSGVFTVRSRAALMPFYRINMKRIKGNQAIARYGQSSQSMLFSFTQTFLTLVHRILSGLKITTFASFGRSAL